MGRYLDIIERAQKEIKAIEDASELHLFGGVCKACAAEIYFVPTVNGKAMPLNTKTEKRIILINLTAHVVDTYVSHFATCPKAEQFRRE